jgi:phage terminase large subunit-like protein
MDKNYILIARNYAKDVVAGRIPACEWTKKACQRQLDDLERKGWAFRFDVKKAARVCQFIEKLPHIKGEWAKAGAKIELQPWQVFILTTVFGWVSRETGLRRFKIAYIEVPRKNGKSTFSSGVALYCLMADSEAGAEVYSAATTRDQARIVWQDAKAMVDRTPGMQSAFGVSAEHPLRRN